jgi:hypothetical protein
MSSIKDKAEEVVNKMIASINAVDKNSEIERH